MDPVAGRPEPSSEEVYSFFTEQMWRPSVMLWVGWAAAGFCVACAVFTFKTYGANVFGGLLIVAAIGLALYMVRMTLRQRKRWVHYVNVTQSQIRRDFERPDSTLCLVQSFPLGLRDRLMLVKKSDLHFKGYFMPAGKARRLAGARGIGYVESAKIISGVLSLNHIKSFVFRRALRLRYAVLAFIGLGGGTAFLPKLLAPGEHSAAEVVGVIVFYVAGALAAALLFLHRFSLAVIQTDDYELNLMANRPSEKTVMSFLRRLGYSEMRERAKGGAARQSQIREKS